VTGKREERVEVFFNPACSKCRSLGALLDERGVAWNPIAYLDGALRREKLREVLEKLGCGPAEIIRWEEQVLKEKGITKRSGLPDEALLDLMIAHPIIIQRPIVLSGERAIIGRPPEKVLDLL